MHTQSRLSLLAAAACLWFGVHPGIAAAQNKQRVCLNQATSKITVRPRCKKSETALSGDNLAALISATGQKGDRGPTGPTGAAGAKGATGEPGAKGAPGSTDFLVYGDGSAGDYNESNAFVLLDRVNKNFDHITISSATTMLVPSGTVFRCKSGFTNQGAIVVVGGATGGFTDGASEVAHNVVPRMMPAEPSVFGARAANGEWSFDQYAAKGGMPMAGTLPSTARQTLRFGRVVGGGGGAGGFGGGGGGGSLTVLCAGPIANSGDIYASGGVGGNGGGGGGGGAVILASRVSITNSGGLHARGGDGGMAAVNTGPGGGGGGGILHLIAPVINHSGMAVIGGGSAGANAVTTFASRTGGGSGGGSAGMSGSGGTVPFGVVNPATPAATAGVEGYFFQTLEDPTALF